ncbi:hypothetical protein [uncultured Sphingomonas sp.]|uniref:hypothetical protein n=1 Tax=uncultured Sphingomonas sp. TaxID=158754 RepID=UPI0035CB4416
MDVLRIRFRPDDEWLGRLVVSASANGFAGVGEAWFSKDNLREFAQAITALPLPADTPPSISGGLGGNEKNSPQDLVTITFEPHNSVGGVRATVHLETANWDGKERGLYNETTIRFLVTYGDLGRFAPALLDAIDGHVEEAVLTATP